MRILMVCLGNICRSPLAEGILKQKSKEKGVVVDSAGTASYHIGKLPDSRSIEIANKYQKIATRAARRSGIGAWGADSASRGCASGDFLDFREN